MRQEGGGDGEEPETEEKRGDDTHGVGGLRGVGRGRTEGDRARDRGEGEEGKGKQGRAAEREERATEAEAARGREPRAAGAARESPGARGAASPSTGGGGGGRGPGAGGGRGRAGPAGAGGPGAGRRGGGRGGAGGGARPGGARRGRGRGRVRRGAAPAPPPGCAARLSRGRGAGAGGRWRGQEAPRGPGPPPASRRLRAPGSRPRRAPCTRRAAQPAHARMARRAAGGAPHSARAAAASPPPPRPPRRAPRPCPLLPPLLLLLGAARAGALEVQRRFPSPTPTNNFALDGAAGTVYLAAVNRLYQLSGANLSLEAEAAVGPVADSPLCHAPQLPQASCEHPRRLTDNYNKILQLDPGQGLVVACGSIYQGFCQLRRRGNISAVAVRFPPAAPPAEPVTVFPSMLNVAANHPNASTVGLVLPPAAGSGGSRLLVGATYTGYGSAFFPRNRSLEDHRFENTPEIAIRSLDARGDLAKLFTFDLNPSDDNILKIKQGAKEQHKLGFVRAFLHPPEPPPGAPSYAYLALNSEARAGDKESQARSLLARICLPRGAGGDAKKLTESYIQLGLQCAGGAGRGDLYSRLVSVFPARELLFAVFERPQGSPAARATPAALCAFRFADVQAAIRAARNACFVEPAPDVVAVLDSVVQGTGPACERKRNIQLQPEQLDCGAAHLQHPLSILQPLKATPVFRAPGLSSVAVASVSNYTVVFLGTVSGRLLKINLNESMQVVSRRAVTVAYGEPVHHVMQFDPADPGYLYLMTSHQMARVKVAACAVHTTCGDCVGAADAYCGWCALETRCTLQQDCANSSQRHFWTSASEGPSRCPTMTVLPAEIDVHQEYSGMILQISGSLPSLSGMEMACDYGNNIRTVARVPGPAFDHQIAYCNLLPRDQFPPFPPHQDHVIVEMSVRVNGRNIVRADFTIYNCSRVGQVYPHTACTSCLSAQWPCFWCAQQHACVSNQSRCEASPNPMNPQDCPQILPSALAPMPTGSSQSIPVHLANAAFQGAALECSFGPEEVFEAIWVNESTVHCNQVVLHTTQKSQVFPLSLQLKGQPARFLDSPDPMTVEVYNCAMGSPDCSQCLGREDLGHLCVWSDGCRLRGPLQPLPGTCPAPEIRTDCVCHRASPRAILRRGDSERLQGGQVTGALLLRGKGGHSHLPAHPTSHTWGESLRPHHLSPSLQLPLVQFLEPDKGPKAGGTRIIIHGSDLHVGSELQVLVNDTEPCTELVRTEASITCTVPEGALPAPVPVCVRFERRGCVRSNLTFQYMQNPVITAISPRRSPVSGGRTITVAGERFHMVQNVSMAVHHIGREPTLCKVLNSTLITCPSPGALSNASAPVDFFINGRAYADEAAVAEELLDPDEARRGSRFRLDYLPDPQFSTAKREKWIKHHPGEPLTLVIHKEQDSLGLESHEYRIKIGQVACDIQIVSDRVIHCSVNESLGTAEGQLPITIQVGNFNQTIATLQLGGSETAIIVSIVICSVLLLLSVVALFVFCTKSRRAERYWQKTLLQMEEMESQIREEIRKGFAELQTDMTDLTKELNRSQGIPFLEYKHFVTRTFFPKCSSLYEERYVLPSQTLNSQGSCPVQETHPLLGEWKIPESCRPNMEEGISLFSSLLNNKHFLIVFVHALEQQKDFAVRDRCSLASLLTIALHGKLEYYTGIMKELLVDLIDASAAKNPKLMLRRTESVVEKMLTNWMSICMYSCLRETVGEPFFLLLCAIKQQINKGSIDAITGKARYTLNEEWLLRENIEAKPRNLNVSFQGCGMDSLSVRAMDTDTLTQVKEKILEAFCKNVPYSQWPRAEDVDLEWFASSTQSYILRDLDDTSVVEDGRKKLNTLAHYKIPEGASLAMSLTDKKDNTLGRVKDLDTEKYFHLVLPTDELAEPKKSHRQSHRKKVLPEIYLTRLLSTKGTLQKFLDDLFKAILSIREDKPPLAVKYFFDFLEEQAEKRGISDPDTLHIWKTNSLPLRFWVNILKNPQFVFDIDKTDHIDACLSVIAQAFIDACSISDLQLGKDSPTNKLLYAKEIPEYRKIVQRYYKQIHDMTPLSEQEMNAHLAEESRKYQNEFNTNVAMAEIYKYAKRYRTQIMTALEANPTARRTQLQHKFEQVVALMEDNIYECYSEA
uniref:Plexin-D1 n=1 Tax=Canis lupus familiaris TaxID=9615 RepID=A0A8C0PBK9_CANLF